MNEKKISFTINGTKLNRTVEVHRTLVEFIRDGLGLTGTKEGCDEGECGACTVLFDGKPIHSCCTLAVEIDGHEIVTIEGLSRMGTKAMTCLDPIQQAFVDVGAVQCGFCTPGMILSAKALLDENKNPTDAEMRTAIEGNICRCTGYDRIVEAIKLAAERMK
jgi:carbon-monoxide dehydrogenase small subunit